MENFKLENLTKENLDMENVKLENLTSKDVDLKSLLEAKPTWSYFKIKKDTRSPIKRALTAAIDHPNFALNLILGILFTLCVLGIGGLIIEIASILSK